MHAPPIQTEIKEVTRHTVLVYLKGEKYVRADFLGDLPAGLIVG